MSEQASPVLFHFYRIRVTWPPYNREIEVRAQWTADQVFSFMLGGNRFERGLADVLSWEADDAVERPHGPNGGKFS